jgi:hypothetical protein
MEKYHYWCKDFGSLPRADFLVYFEDIQMKAILGASYVFVLKQVPLETGSRKLCSVLHLSFLVRNGRLYRSINI